MKTKIQAVFFLLGLALFLAEANAGESFEYKKRGFFLGGELGVVGGFDIGSPITPGKLDLLAGYQIHPYVSVAADLWTFLFIAFAAEAQAKVNFTDSKISPYFVGTGGVVAIAALLAEDDADNGAITGITYSAGLGADFHLWKSTTLFAEARYRGVSGLDFDSEVGHGLEAGVGLRKAF